MKRNNAVIITVLLMLCVGFSAFPAVGFSHCVSSDGTTLYVGGSGPGNYTYIQEAINAASDNDTIFVFNGTYEEHIVVDKPLHLVGEDKEITVIDGGGTGDVVLIYSSFVIFHDFTVEKSGQGMRDHGVTVSDEKFVSIYGCIVKNNAGGIRFNSVSDSLITDCHIHNNSWCSITVYLSSSNILIANCTIGNNGIEGQPGRVDIAGIEALCSNITVKDCDIYGNWDSGIGVSRSKNVEIHHNNIYKNTKKGIFVTGSSAPLYDIVIHDNNIWGNGRDEYFNAGIMLSDCLDCVTIKNNNIKSNNRNGIFLLRSSGNIILENNFIDNAHHAFFDNKCFSKNSWNGNYWGRGRLLPKPIFGLITITENITIPWVNFDWHPALRPYEI